MPRKGDGLRPPRYRVVIERLGMREVIHSQSTQYPIQLRRLERKRSNDVNHRARQLHHAINSPTAALVFLPLHPLYNQLPIRDSLLFRLWEAPTLRTI